MPALGVDELHAGIEAAVDQVRAVAGVAQLGAIVGDERYGVQREFWGGGEKTRGCVENVWIGLKPLLHKAFAST